jgi:hypothetical protein
MYGTVGLCHAGNLIARVIDCQVCGRLRGGDIGSECCFWQTRVSCWIGSDSGYGFAIGLWWVYGDGKRAIWPGNTTAD